MSIKSEDPIHSIPSNSKQFLHRATSMDFTEDEVTAGCGGIVGDRSGYGVMHREKAQVILPTTTLASIKHIYGETRLQSQFRE